MVLSVADIAKKALDSVASKLSGVVRSAWYYQKDSTPTYDPVTGLVSESPTTLECRLIDETGNIGNITRTSFPTYIITGAEKVFFVEGLSEAPKNEGVFQFKTGDTHLYHVKAVQDLLGNGTTFRVIVL